jgi:hypothetical protein
MVRTIIASPIRNASRYVDICPTLRMACERRG